VSEFSLGSTLSIGRHLVSKARRMLALVRFRPFDISTAAGRSEERLRLIALSALASGSGKIISMVTALISVPLTLHYLGAERYGMWLVVSSFVAILGFADLGVGNGVLTLISQRSGTGDSSGIRGVVSSAFVILTLIAAVLGMLFAATSGLVSWQSLFNVSSPLARAEAAPAVATFVACFLVSIPLGVVQKVQVGLQQGFVSALWQSAGSILGFLAVLIVIHLEGGVSWLIFALIGVPQITVIANNFFFFSFERRDIAPRLDHLDIRIMARLLRTGLLFLVLQLVVATTYNSDSLIITRLLGPTAVAEYAVPQRLFSVISMLLAMLTAPLWPAFGEALGRGDRAWVRRAMKISLSINVGLAALASFGLVLIGPWLIHLWIGQLVGPSLLLLLGFAVWKLCEALGGPLAMLLNGAHVIIPQIICSVLTALLGVWLKIFFIGHIGVAGAIWANVAAYTTLSLAPLAIIMRNYLKD
jgi:O-antigen/teichoic acid export membrane protein